MSDETLVSTEPQTENLEQGTTDAGQSSQSDAGSQPNDPQAFQADYTRKYQELADQRRAFDSEKQAFEAQRSQFVSQGNGYSVQQRMPQQQMPSPQQSQQMTDNQLVDLFGTEGANAIRQREQALTNQFQQSQIDLHLSLEEMKAKQKFGEAEWNKHNYVNPMTGKIQNRIMDYRLSINPITGASLTLDDAYTLVNRVDPKVIEQQTRDKVYLEMKNKTLATPASASKSAPRATGTGHATSIADAFDQAAAEAGWTD